MDLTAYKDVPIVVSIDYFIEGSPPPPLLVVTKITYKWIEVLVNMLWELLMPQICQTLST